MPYALQSAHFALLPWHPSQNPFPLRSNLKSRCRIIYFEKDRTKSGGQYMESVLSFKRIDELNKVLYFKENIQIQIDDIVDIEILEH